MRSLIDKCKKILFFYFQRKKHKIYDCFLFFNENDLLEIRLNELNDVVDYFVIFESQFTFTKKDKPFNFDINKVQEFKDKIIYIKNNDFIKSPNPWEMEKYQRNKLFEGLKNAEDNDLIILSDLDEIPKKEAVINAFYMCYNKKIKYIRFYLKVFRYAFNNIMESQDGGGPIACRKEDISSMEELRHKHKGTSSIKDAGWHYSYMMSIEQMIYKLKSYSHQEYNKWPNNDPVFMQERIKKGQSTFSHEEQSFRLIHLNRKNCPKYLLKNKQKYDKLIFKHEKTSFWTQITSLYNKKICQIKKCAMGLRNKSS